MAHFRHIVEPNKLTMKLIDSVAASITVASAVAEETVRVWAYDLRISAAGTIEFESNDTTLSGVMTVSEQAGHDFLNVRDGAVALFEGGAGDDLTIEKDDGAKQLSGWVLYSQD